MLRYLNVLVVLFLIVPGFVIADIVDLAPTDDAHVWLYEPNSNVGYSTNLTVGYISGWANTLMKFDLSAYAGATINSAVIRIYVWDLWGTVPTDQIYIGWNLADWDESTVTWNNNPNFNQFALLTAPSAIGWWEIDVTDLVQLFANGTYPNYGFQIYKATPVEDSIYMKSKENAGDNPYLHIDYTPMHLENTTFGAIKAMFF